MNHQERMVSKRYINMSNHRKPTSNKGKILFFNREGARVDNASTIFLSLPPKTSTARNGLHLVE